MKRFLWCCLLMSASVSADLFTIGQTEWQQRSFQGNTDYRFTTEQSVPVLRAETQGQASALYRQIKIDLRQTPWLSWQWRIDRVYPSLDPLSKQGDDYPARVYVVVRDGWLPWQTLAINYVWANTAVAQTHWPNPFTDKAVMVPLQAGADGVGQWRQQRVNVREDFKRLFGRDIDFIDGVAVMTDGDNSGNSAVAWYAAMTFSR